MKVVVPLDSVPLSERITKPRGRPPSGMAMSGAERMKRLRAPAIAAKAEDIAVIDFETDPFDRDTRLVVRPFLAVLASRQFPTVVIWEEDEDAFISAVLAAIEALPRSFTIYAHNGGKFDFMFLVHRLRGVVMFKGRGIMSARIGNHNLRDSMHIIPERLASYKKDDFDYTTLSKSKRGKSRKKIIEYCKNDCAYLLDIVLAFVERHGLKISIGSAAAKSVKDAGIEVEKFNEVFDEYIRPYYFGGRVECLAGIGHFISTADHQFKLYDVNSMYPTAMALYEHPIGGPSDYFIRGGKLGPNTVFIDLTCDNDGALVARGEDGETSARVERGRFQTTIWEYKAAKELGLIRNITFHTLVDCEKRANFKPFVDQWYGEKDKAKDRLDALKKAGKGEEDNEYMDAKKDYMFAKFFLNNAYGKYAQNPRKFKESYITNYGERPVEIESKGFKCCDLQQEVKRGYLICSVCGGERPGFGPLPQFEDYDKGYAIWERRAAMLRFNNVGTAASITGAARAILMRALAAAVDPIYCDTDSIIASDLPGVELHPTKLGAWDIEDSYSEVIVCGKKLYACKLLNGKFKYRMKGGEGAEWDDYLAMLADQEHSYTSRAKGPTMTRSGSYFYMTRNVRATGPKVGNLPLLNRKKT